MDKKTTDILWSVSLIVLALGTVINSARYIFDVTMPDALTVAIGVADLAAIFILFFTTVRKKIDSKNK